MATEIVPDTPAERAHCCQICMDEAAENREATLAVECYHLLETLLPKQKRHDLD